MWKGDQGVENGIHELTCPEVENKYTKELRYLVDFYYLQKENSNEDIIYLFWVQEVKRVIEDDTERLLKL